MTFSEDKNTTATKAGRYLYRDVPGWFHEHTAATLEQLIVDHHISQVIEIGSYLGKSAIFFAARVLETLCIDPFVMWPDGRKNGDAMRDGGEDFYDKFLVNFEHARSSAPRGIAALRVVRSTSALAWENNPDLKADLIYIDGQHDYESVLEDIQMWYTRAHKIICGDDYDENWPGVMKAVDEMFPDRLLVGNFWYKII